MFKEYHIGVVLPRSNIDEYVPALNPQRETTSTMCANTVHFGRITLAMGDLFFNDINS